VRSSKKLLRCASRGLRQFRQHLGIQHVTVGPFELGFSEMMGMRWIDHTHGKSRLVQGRRQTHPIDAGCFHDDQDASRPLLSS